ncbi:MAG: signal peptidase II [Bacillota bacterium]
MQLFLIIAFAILLDQGSKMFIQSTMHLGDSLPVIWGIFHITFIKNPGAAFGVLANRTSLFVAITVLVVLVILALYRQIPPEWKILRIGLAMLVGGALGNLLDRVRMGTVVDFLDLRFWPIFNLADTFVVVGVILLCWELLRPNPVGNKKRVEGEINGGGISTTICGYRECGKSPGCFYQPANTPPEPQPCTGTDCRRKGHG